MNVELNEAQRIIEQAIVTRRRIMIVAPMGAGKTLATLHALEQLPELRRVLVIAPKRVAQSVWVQEAEKFQSSLHVRFCLRALDVKLFLMEPSDRKLCVCSVTRIGEIPHGCWDAVILDESTLFKHPRSIRSKQARRICNKVPYRILLTGTPIHNGYEGLWHQCLLVDGGAALGRSLTEFRRRYERVKFQVNGVVSVYEVDPQKTHLLAQDCRPIVCVVRNYVALPPILYKTIAVALPDAVLARYKDFEASSVLTYREQTGTDAFDGKERTLIAFSRASLGLKLRQFASGFLYTDEQCVQYQRLHRAKIETLRDIAEAQDRPILVAYQFRSELAELQASFPRSRTLDTAADIEEWNAGCIPMGLVHPQSCGHGLNLQDGGCTLVWFSLTYDAELYAQLNKRLHRRGQCDTVSILHLVAAATIDERIMKVLLKKQTEANMFNEQIGYGKEK